jgi:DNA-binding CsgD family transcriptional regulator
MANPRTTGIPIDNRLLDALERAVEAELVPQLEAIYLELMECLFEEGKCFERVLPLAMDASRIRLTKGSPCLEVSAENDGFTGAPASYPVTRALTAGTDLHGSDRRRCHGAQTATHPTDAAKDMFAGSVVRARVPGEPSAPATFLETTAAEFTSDPALPAGLPLAVGYAERDEAAPTALIELLARAKRGPLDDLQRARLERLRAKTAFARKRGSDAVPLLLDAARRLVPLHADVARETYLEAFQAALAAGRLCRESGVEEVATVAQHAPPPRRPPTTNDLLLDGLVRRFTTGYSSSVPLLRQALEASWHEVASIEDLLFRWSVAADLWDDGAMHALGTRALRLARQQGALAFLPMTLPHGGGAGTYGGQFAAAWALLEEAEAITEATVNVPFRHGRLVLSACCGQDAETLELFRATIREANARGDGCAIGSAEYATAVFYNGRGRYEVALDAAQRACEHEDLSVFNSALVELVEAASRSNRADVGAVAMMQLEERADAAGTHWALGLKARSQALLSERCTAERFFVESIEHLARTRVDVELGRAHLLYGEWLRREKRRRDARQQLRTAHKMLRRKGAQTFAERARHELLATAESVRRRNPATITDLTAQERQIGGLAAGGYTNREIGAKLFISARTVEWHMGNVFTKLGIASRRELRQVLAGLSTGTWTDAELIQMEAR